MVLTSCNKNSVPVLKHFLTTFKHESKRNRSGKEFKCSLTLSLSRVCYNAHYVLKAGHLRGGQVFCGERFCLHVLPPLLTNHNTASPKLTLVLRVHRRIRLTAKVLWKFRWIWNSANDSKSWWAVRVCDHSFMWTLWCPDWAPYLSKSYKKQLMVSHSQGW